MFKNFPLDPGCNDSVKFPIHPLGCQIAIMARCAGRHGKFKEFHHLAFAQQEVASTGQVRKWAQEVGLKDADIDACVKDVSIVTKIKDDAKVGAAADITATPTVYINGHKYIGERFDGIRTAIKQSLGGD